MELDFRCRLINEFGNVLSINLSESHPAFSDILNTFCGANPVEWIGKNSHDKVIHLTSDFKKHIFEICAESKQAEPNFKNIERFFKEQPDNSYVSYLREGLVDGNAENRLSNALQRALVANYKAWALSRRNDEKISTIENSRIKKTLFCIASEGETWTYDFPENFPEERLRLLFDYLHVATDMSMLTMHNGNNFWRLSVLRELIKSNEIAESKVGGLLVSFVRKLKGLEDNEAVVFGILQSANETQLENMVQACKAFKFTGTVKPLYDQLMANERCFNIEGYTHRSFTDFGFEHKIVGKKVCRFCGKSKLDGVTFKNKPHAISYFWGNHNLLGAGECDICNGTFGQILEPQALRYYYPTMINCGLTGRGKNPKILGENFALSIGNVQILSIENDNVWERLCNGEEVRQEFNDHQPVIKADIYRCFCKYIVSLIKDEELPEFKETVRWIMKERLSDESLPPTLRNETDFGCTKKPTIEIFTKESTDAKSKIYIVVFRFITNLWIYAIPYVGGCDNSELKKELLAFQKKFFSNFKFVEEDFGIEDFTYTTTHNLLSVSKETQIKRVCDMTPEEREDFCKHIPKKWRGFKS